MKTVNIQLTIPEDMVPYLTDDMEHSFERNAMILLPYIRVHKTDLIEFFNSIGIPYLNQCEVEFLEDLATLDRVLGPRHDCCASC